MENMKMFNLVNEAEGRASVMTGDAYKEFCNIVVRHHDEFDIKAYADEMIYKDENTPFMIVRHVHGKQKHIHWHVVGKPKPDIKHTKPTVPHPNGTGRGNAAFSWKKGEDGKYELYDVGAFQYIVKPKEWAEEVKAPGSCLIETNVTGEQLAYYVVASRKYAENKKNDIAHTIDNIDPLKDESPEAYHMRVGEAVMAKLHQDQTDWMPHYKYKILKAMHKKGGRYQPYALKKLLM